MNSCSRFEKVTYRLVVLALLSASVASAAAVAAVGPDTWEPGKTYPVRTLVSNRGVRVEIVHGALLDRYGDVAAPAGRRFLLVHMRWENTFPLTQLGDGPLSTEYRIPNLGDHIYVVLDGCRVARLAEVEAGGLLPVRDFALPRLGASLEGNVLFDVPATPSRTMELRFYDFGHGHFSVPLAGDPGSNPSVPVGKLARNEVVEAGIFGVRDEAALDGEAAPEGMRFLVVDYRARSVLVQDADATAFDPAAKPGSRVGVGTVSDWTDSRRHIQLVVDGELAYAPHPLSDLPEAPRFLPDAPTGGDLVFLVPKEARSVELRCDFPNAAVGGGRIIRPAGLVLAIEGKRPPLAEREGTVTIADDVFHVAVAPPTRGSTWIGVPAGEGKEWVTLPVTVTSSGRGLEFFQCLDQVRLAGRDGTPIPMDPLVASGPHPPLPLLGVPPGERRSFEAVFRLPVGLRPLRLAYTGVSLAQVVDVPEAAGVTQVAAVAASVALAPKPTPLPEPPMKEAPKDVPPQEASPVAPVPPMPPVPPREPRGLAGVGLTPEQVNAAIDRGAAFLWNTILEKDLKEHRIAPGDNPEHYLAFLALIHAGAHRKFPEVEKAVRTLLASADPRGIRMYEAGLLCMLVDAFEDPTFLPLLHETTRYIVEAQGPKGSWNYRANVDPAAFADPSDAQPLQVTGGTPINAPDEGPPPLERKLDWKVGQDGDNSVTQYALLGLRSAEHAGLPVGREIWKRAADSFLERQGPDGGWVYNSASNQGYGSMTCAGIASLAICGHALGDADPRVGAAVDRGLAWVAKNFAINKHPNGQDWHLYYLYALERVGRILDVELFGEHEWYPLGARYLLDCQGPDGGWIGRGSEDDPRLATGFALLFLTRATPSLKSEEVARGGNGTLRTGIRLPPSSRLYLILDASGSMLAQLGGTTKWEIARGEVERLVGELPDCAEVGLRAYGHRRRAIEPEADEDTEQVIPLRKLERESFLAKLRALRPRGKTPLALSLKEAAADLRGAVDEERPLTVVLLTDGGEDTGLPRKDPAAAAEELGKLPGIRLHVVGFDIGRDDWTRQLLAIAERAGGQYWPARDGSRLAEELRSVVFGVPESFVVVDADGRERDRGLFGQARTLPEGKYSLRTSFADALYEHPFWINTARVTTVLFDAERALALRPPPGAQPPPEIRPAAPVAPRPAAPAEGAGPKFCAGCGGALKPGAKFCTSCGKRVDQPGG